MTELSDRETGFARINGANLHYEIAGAGHPLVLVHAGIADSRMWDDQFPLFAQHFRTLRYDLRGYGQSDSATEPFAHYRDLYGLMQHLGIEQAHLIGCSMGGNAILETALAHPLAVTALVPVASALNGYDPDTPPLPQFEAFAVASKAGDLEQMCELGLQVWVDGLSRTPDQVDPRLRQKVHDMSLLALQKGAEEAQEESLEPSTLEQLAQINVPTLVIIGEIDLPELNDGCDIIAARINGARKAEIKGATHLPNMEQPEEFNRLVLDFLPR